MWLNGRSSGLRFGSPGSLELTGFLIWLIRTGFILAHLNSDLAHRASSGLAFGSMGVIRAHQDSDLAHQGSSGLIRTQILLIRAHWGSLGLMGTKIWLNVVHWGSSAFKLGSMGVIWGHLDSDMAHQGLSGLMRTQNGSSGTQAHWGRRGSSGL